MQISERSLAGNLIDEHALECCLTNGLRGGPNLPADRRSGAHRATTRPQLHTMFRGRTLLPFVHRIFLEYFFGFETGIAWPLVPASLLSAA
jgi:hypothetical protein